MSNISDSHAVTTPGAATDTADVLSARLEQSLFLLWIITSLIIFGIGSAITLADNEALYWAWSKRPALGYFSHPPLQAWITALVTRMFGDHAWALRAPLVALRLVGLYFFHAWAKARYGRPAAITGSFLFACSTTAIACGLIAFPDAYLFPFVAVLMYYSERGRWLPAGLALGLACLAKWFAVLLIPAWFVALVCNGESRPRGWRNAICAGLLALALQAPVIAWNMQHDWAGLYMQLSGRHHHELPELPTLVRHLGTFTVGQIAMGGFSLLAMLIVMACGAGFKATGIDRTQRKPFVWLWALPTILVFLPSAIIGEFRIYWTWCALIPLTYAIAAALELNARQLFALRATSISLIGIQLSLFLLAYNVPLYGSRTDLRRTLASSGSGWADWRDTLVATNMFRGDTQIVASDFHVASQLAWALKTSDPGSIRVAGIKNQFSYWEKPLASKLGNFLFVGTDRYRGLEQFAAMCHHPLNWASLKVYHAGWHIKDIHWASCHELERTAL